MKKCPLSVLHVGNIAGVAILLSQGLRKWGVKANVIQKKRHPYGFPTDIVLNLSPLHFLYHLNALCGKYHIVHIHGLPFRSYLWPIVLYLKLLGKKVVLHLHGTDIRRKHNQLSTKLVLKTVDMVLVSTRDLLRYVDEATWLPTPIDPMFKPTNRKKAGALYFKKWYETRAFNSNVTVVNENVEYREMPNLLNRYEYFIDQSTFPALSKTALEALACGCKVIGWNGLVANHEKIVARHSLFTVTKKLLNIYRELMA